MLCKVYLRAFCVRTLCSASLGHLTKSSTVPVKTTSKPAIIPELVINTYIYSIKSLCMLPDEYDPDFRRSVVNDGGGVLVTTAV